MTDTKSYGIVNDVLQKFIREHGDEYIIDKEPGWTYYSEDREIDLITDSYRINVVSPYDGIKVSDHDVDKVMDSVNMFIDDVRKSCDTEVISNVTSRDSRGKFHVEIKLHIKHDNITEICPGNCLKCSWCREDATETSYEYFEFSPRCSKKNQRISDKYSDVIPSPDWCPLKK